MEKHTKILRRDEGIRFMGIFFLFPTFQMVREWAEPLGPAAGETRTRGGQARLRKAAPRLPRGQAGRMGRVPPEVGGAGTSSTQEPTQGYGEVSRVPAGSKEDIPPQMWHLPQGPGLVEGVPPPCGQQPGHQRTGLALSQASRVGVMMK